MNTQDVEKLMAYADGELSSSEHAEVQAWLARDPQARATLQAFTQIPPLLKSAYQPVLEEPVPQRLKDAVLGVPGEATQTFERAQGRPPLPKPLPDAPKVLLGSAATHHSAAASAANRPAYWPKLATAASVALLVGLTGGHWWSGQKASPQDLAAQHFQHVMQTVASGESAQSRDQQVTPLASYQSKEGQLCREFEQHLGERLTHGLACKAQNQWTVVVAVDRGFATVTPAGVDEFKLASGEDDLLATAIKGLALEKTLLPNEEAALIQKSWAAPR